MRKFLLAAVAAAAIASPAMARDGQPYIGIEAGVLFARDMNFDYYDGVDTIDNYFEIDHNKGLDVDLIGGYDFGLVRAELELSRKRASHDKYSFIDIGNGPVVENGDGSTKVTSIMGNLLADFGNQDGLSFYGGGGLGYARTKLRFDDGVDSASLKDSHLAWQLIAGVRYAVSPNVDVGLKYRYFNTKFKDNDLFFTSDSVNSKFRSHSLLASLIFNFGAPAPAPVVMAPPPPPPAPMPEPVQTQVCYDGSVIEVTSVCPSPPPPPAPVPQPGERG